jgi:type I restriction enzyme S subunit
MSDTLPLDWEVVTIGKLCERTGGTVQTGPFGSDLHASDYSPTGIPVVMPANLGKNSIVEDGIARVSTDHVVRLRVHRLAKDDIIFPRRGDIARYAVVDEHQVGWLCGTGCLRIRFGANEIIDPHYLGYWLGTSVVENWLLGNAVGTTMPNLNTSILKALPVPLPSLPEQREIARILGALDDKIDINRRMNATLEATARALFQSWFVDFDPVRAKAEGRQPEGMDAETAALFPDALEDSTLGWIPRGWEVGTLSDLAKNPRRSVDPLDVPLETPYIGLEHMPKHSIALTAWGSALDVESQKLSFFEDEVLLGKLRPYFHKVGFAPLDGICSTDILVLAPHCSCFWGYLMMVSSDDKFIDYLSQLSTGTRMPRAKWSDAAQYRLVLPDSRAVKTFNSFMLPIAELIKRNIFDSRSLSLLRDFLLPLLIKGELQVTELQDGYSEVDK